MHIKETPFAIEGIEDNLYAGFWTRLGSLLLDFLFIIPVVYLVLYVNSLSKNNYFYSLVPNLLFTLWYHVYLPKKYGGTPGKLVVGIKIIRLDGEPIGWREALLRHIVLLALTLLSVIVMTSCLLKADPAVFSSLGWLDQSKYITSLSPVFFIVYTWVNNVWIYSEFIVLLTNKRKRAIHDFIAGTVIIQAKYYDRIREEMNAVGNDNDISEN